MDTLTAAWYRRQASISRNAATAVEKLWGQVDPSAISETWEPLIPRAVEIVTAGQVAAATMTTDYVSGSVRRQDVEPDPVGRVDPLAFVSSGIGPGLVFPAIRAKQRIALGMPIGDAMLSGRFQALTFAATSVADAGKLSTQVAVTNDRAVTGYTRVVNVPACGRCIVLAGKFYKHNQGFQRHPRCDCVHQPTTLHPERAEAEALAERQRLVDGMSGPDKRRAFTNDGARAVDDGADISQVVNSRSGMATPGAQTTTADTNLRYARARERGVRTGQVGDRLSVQGIYAEAGDSRDRAIELLFQHGYIR